MKKEIIIYHGSQKIIDKPIYGVGNPKNDYGLAFYCTENLELAKEWAVDEGRDGYSNKYRLDVKGLTCLDLSSKEYNILHWITLLLSNRVFDLKSDIAKAGKEYLTKNFSLPYYEYDLIKGYRADDSYFSFAESFLNNTISCQRLSQALRLGNLGEQIALKSERAFSLIEFLGYEVAPADVYYPLRKQRNEKARIEFLSDKQGVYNPDAVYLNDILRGGIDKFDSRLR